MDSEFRLLEICIPSGDVRASLDWYVSLGFAEQTTGDIRNYHYAVVSDGDIYLGLHGAGIEQPGLSFVRQELATYVRAEESAGREFEFTRLGVDDFHEAIRLDPAGNALVLVEARTFSRSPDSAAVVIGELQQAALPCTNADAALEFWDTYGFISVQADVDAPAELHMPGLTLQMRNGTRELTLVYRSPDLAATLAKLTQQGITARPSAEGHVLQAPEGTRIVLENA